MNPLIKTCINCNQKLPKRRHKYCSNYCRRSYNSRKNNPNIKYWKFIFHYIKIKKSFSVRQIAYEYYEKNYGNNLKNCIRKEILGKYINKFARMIGILTKNKKVIIIHKVQKNKRYLVNKLLLHTIEKIINRISVFDKSKERNININNVDWILFNQLTTYSLYFLCKLDGKIDNNFRILYNKLT